MRAGRLWEFVYLFGDPDDDEFEEFISSFPIENASRKRGLGTYRYAP